MQRVEDILDLKFCTDGVQTALQDEDYEKVIVLTSLTFSVDRASLLYLYMNRLCTAVVPVSCLHCTEYCCLITISYHKISKELLV